MFVRKIVKRRAFRYKNTKTNQFKTFEDGYEFGDKLVKSWNSQQNQQNVYSEGYRIQHGLVEVALELLG